DWNNDGLLDLVILHLQQDPSNQSDPSTGPVLYQQFLNGSNRTFVKQPTAFPSTETYGDPFGMNIYDINNDGFEDVLIVGGGAPQPCDPKIFLNNGIGFVRAFAQARPFTLGPHSTDPAATVCNGRGAMAFGDINGDNRIDVLYTNQDIK